MKIRPVATGDVEQILDLFEAVAFERLWIGTEPGFNRSQYAEFVLAAFQTPNVTVAFVAVDENDEVLGQIAAHCDPEDRRWSLGMLIRKEHRRRGIGSALLSDLIQWAKNNSVTELYLEVFPHNEPALQLYGRFGFVKSAYYEKRLTRRDGEQWDTIEMVLSL